MQRTITLLALALFTIFFATRTHSSSNGPGGGYTGAPSENDCTSCHSGTLRTSGAKWGRIRLIGNFTGNGYIPDSTYTLAVSYRESGRSKFGFQITCLNGSNAPAGSFTATTTRVQRVTRNINSQTREYIEQTSSGTSGVTSDSTIWFFSWKAPATNQGDLSFYVALNATNSNSQSSGDSIYTKKFTLGPSSLLPTAKAGADASTTCTNYQFQFRGTGTSSPTSWAWSFPTGNPSSSTSQNPLVSYSGSGNKIAILTVRNAKGVSKPDTFRFSVTQSPVVTILGSNSISLCQGDSAQLTCGQTGIGIRYFWPAVNASTRSITVKDSNDYRVVLTNTLTGCSTLSAPVRVRILPRPAPVLTATPDSVCAGEPFILSATPAPLDSYYFYRNGKLESKGKSSTYNTSAIEGEVLSVQARSSNGCFAAARVNANLLVRNPLPKPAPFLVQRSTDGATIAWKRVPGNIGYQASSDSGRTWSKTFTDTFISFAKLNPDSRYRLHVRALSPSPCTDRDSSIEIRTLPCSGLRFEVRYDSLLCAGDTGKILITGLKGSRYGVSLGSTYTRDTLFRFAPDRNTDYLLRVKDSAALACPDILRNLPVKVSQPIALVLSPAPAADKLCAGDTFNLQIPAGFDAAVLYVNKQNGISFNNSIRIPGLKAGDSLYVVGENGACTARSPMLNIQTLPLPDARFTIQTGNPHVFAPLDTAHIGYNWSFGDGNMSSARTAFHSYAASETGKTLQVKLRVTGKNGCAGETVQSYQVPDVSAVLPTFWKGLQVYPVPAGNDLNVDFAGAAQLDAVLCDARGVAFLQQSGSGKLRFTTTGIPAGFYFLRIQSGGQIMHVPVYIAH